MAILTNMDSEISTDQKYLQLNPREASFREIFGVLFSDDIQEYINDNNFINVKQTVIERRRFIFLSLLVQKVLQVNEKLLSSLGSGLETSLNVLTNRSNLTIFLKNIFRGKVMLPDKDSTHFSSMMGLLDSRLELDKNIKAGSSKYFANLSAMASKLAYENNEFIKHTVENIWKMKLLGAYDFWDARFQENTTQCFIFLNKNTDPHRIVVAFRGTEPFNADDWCTDFDISFNKLQNIKGKVHSGFMKALGLTLDSTWPKHDNLEHQYAYNTITDVLKSHLRNDSLTKFIVTGHSLGGALAVLFPAVLALHNEINILERLEAVYTFGQPRVGDEKFGKFMKDQFMNYGVKYWRFVYSHDIVPRIPFDNSALTFRHFGTCLYINNLYEASVVEEEPLKNYFELGRSVITERLDALWEMVRSFILPYMFGQDYKEGLLQWILRVFGLFFPGLPDHGLQDYINATRLAI